MSTAAPGVPACTTCAIHVESVFHVAGMCCADEALLLERRLGPLTGVERLSVDVVGQKMHVAYDAAVLTRGPDQRRGGGNRNAGLARARAPR